ncbi:3-methyl-2-oxobutanoate hydroxymethyltransferase, partial [Staphylococcus hominis]|uniref:3-methyl-2-oxobutanoate hydroxymethyltransferase n=1 Tax=Staphylococcus hominis TaxID=1290 RepID=UPI0037094A06
MHIILLGDSLRMTLLPYHTTTQLTLHHIIHHRKPVRPAPHHTFILLHLPIPPLPLSPQHHLNHPITLYQQTNPNPLKPQAPHLTH